LDLTGLFVATATHYKDQLLGLLPPGLIWAPRLGTRLVAYLLAVGDELARVHGRTIDALDEIDPRLADETIGDWETMLGLPGSCVDPSLVPTTLADRRLAAHASYISTGGSTAAYLIELAAALGITITIDEAPYEAFRTGRNRTGQALNSQGAAFVFRVDAPAATSAAKRAQLECLIAKASHAHTAAEFTYT
jgi:uncharacterized protein YmfQ (DUF2313 family)